MTSSKAPVADVTVIIVAYASREWLPRCLDALSKQTLKPARVIVVENGSPADTRVTRSDIPAWIDFIEYETNLGFAAANNEAARLADTKWIALLNPDAFAEPDWLAKLFDAAGRWPDAKIFGSTQLAYGRSGILDGAGDGYHAFGLPFRGGYGLPVSYLPEEGETFSACAAAMMINRQLFMDLGGFDEHYFCYCEDVDLGFRARLRGEFAIQVSDAVVKHVGYGSSGRWSPFAVYHGTRNRLWTFAKNMPFPWVWILLPMHAAATIALQFAAIRRGVPLSYFRGLIDGVFGAGPILAQRKAVQAQRGIKRNAIMRVMAWNPFELLGRKPHVIPAWSRGAQAGHENDLTDKREAP